MATAARGGRASSDELAREDITHADASEELTVIDEPTSGAQRAKKSSDAASSKSEGGECVDSTSARTPLDPLSVRGGKRDFGFLPTPKHLRWDPDARPQFTLLLNAMFGFSATFTVANLYYVQSTLIALAEYLEVDYDTVTDVPTLLQTGYAFGLLAICPLGDLVRRRPLLLILVTCSCVLSLALAFIKDVVAFEVVCFFVAISSVTPQVLLPLAGDLAPPHRRAGALSIVLAGLLLGILFARLLAGIIAEFASIPAIYFMSFGLQMLILALFYFMLPDYPRKNPDLHYGTILLSMAKYAVTEPALVQSCLMGFATSAIFTAFWTTSTFLLGEHYGYNELEIGLFALIGIAGVCTAPFVGRLVDRLVPWTGILVGILVVTVSQIIYTGAAGVSIGALVVVTLLQDIGQQLSQVSHSNRIFGINPPARARFSAVFIFSLFLGQLAGTAAGTRVYLYYGWRASGGFCLGLLGWQMLCLVMRGPQLPNDRWFGYAGTFYLRKSTADRKLAERAAAKDVEGKA